MKKSTRAEIATALRAAATTLLASVEYLPLLRKVAAQTKVGAFELDHVVGALNIVDPGWSLETTTTWKSTDSKKLQAALGQLPSGFEWDDDVIRGTINKEDHTGLDKSAVSAFAAKVKKAVTLVKRTDVADAADGLYATAVSLVKTPLYAVRMWSGVYDAHGNQSYWADYMLQFLPAGTERDVPAYSIKVTMVAPENVTVIKSPDGKTAEGSANLFPWIYKVRPDVIAKAKAYVASDEAKDGEVRKAVGNDAGKLGHCPVCSKLQKLAFRQNTALMVLHGYARPGWGFISGSCFGVDSPPYELSAEGCVDYIAYLEREMANPGKEKFHRMMKQDIDVMKEKVKNWKLRPLPGL